ncbi:MAG: cobalamin-dependent protein [Gracilimonas sp.]
MNSDLNFEILQLESNREKLAEEITELHFKNNPELEKRYGDKGRDYCYEDALYHLNYLIESLRVESTEMFNHYLEWAYHMLKARDIPKKDLVHNLEYMEQAFKQVFKNADMSLSLTYVQAGKKHLQDLKPVKKYHLKPENLLYNEAKEYLDLLLDSKRQQAAELIDELVKKDVPVKDIYEHIFQATQYEIGALWQRNEITVAHEHYCTAATQLIMSRLYPLVFSNQKKGSRMVACSVSNELHEIGIRMIADFFEMDGWDTYYMGSNMPDNHLIQSIKENRANLLAISVTLPIHIKKVTSLIEQIRNMPDMDHVKIMAGGYPFSIIPDLQSRIGADATAMNARLAIETANQLVN